MGKFVFLFLILCISNELIFAQHKTQQQLARYYNNELSHILSIDNYNDAGQPVKKIAKISFGPEIKLPAYIEAIITHQHVIKAARTTRPSLDTAAINDQMNIMGQLDTDEKGHLLAHSLGGATDRIVIVPQAKTINRHFAQTAENKIDKFPASTWKSTEEYLLDFLKSRVNARVNWKLSVNYNPNIFTGLNRNYRPTSFSLRFRTYLETLNGPIICFDSPDYYFNNNNEQEAGYRNSATISQAQADRIDKNENLLIGNCRGM